MPRRFRSIPFLLATGVFAVGWASGQAQRSLSAQARPPAAYESVISVRNISIEHTDGDVAVAITSNGALIPAITKLDGPPRLVIDLAGAVDASPRARLSGIPGSIKSIRVSQYQRTPPLTRVVVDLSEQWDYAWETVEDKLLVHLRRPQASADVTDGKPAAPALTTKVEPAIAYAGSGSVGQVQEVKQQTSGPSSVTAGEETTVLNLARGGQIRVCPGTTISVTSSGDKRDVMLSMSTGSFEAHYELSDSADSVLTPDFRILLPGPGQCALAISADSHGNTCVRSLAGNTASAVVSELIGDGTYQVKADEQVMFHNGQLAKADHNVPIDCGCPAAPAPVLRAEGPPSAPPGSEGGNDSSARGEPLAANPNDSNGGVAVQMSPAAPDLAAVAALKSSEVHMQVDAPLVYRANDPLPAPTEEAQKLPVLSVPPQTPTIVALPPPKPTPGFFGRLKHFLSSVFG